MLKDSDTKKTVINDCKQLRQYSLWQHSRHTFYKSGRKNQTHYQLKYLLYSLRHHQAITILKNFFDQQKLSKIIWNNPRILEKVFRGYLYKGCSKKNTVAIMQQHYQYLLHTLPRQTIEKIYSDGIRIDIPQPENTAENELCHLKLYYNQMFEKEGELTFSLFHNNNQIYTINFSFITTDNQNTAAFIGCIKGPNNNTPQHNQLIKKITRQYHGLRPQSLLFESLALFLEKLDCRIILGVTNQGHIYQRKTKHKSRVNKNYDHFWMDYQAKPFNHYSMQITLPLQRKDMTDIKSSKRSMYRKRFALLDAIQYEISKLK